MEGIQLFQSPLFDCIFVLFKSEFMMEGYPYQTQEQARRESEWVDGEGCREKQLSEAHPT